MARDPRATRRRLTRAERTRSCVQCGKPFIVAAPHSRQMYCGQSCAGRARSKPPAEASAAVCAYPPCSQTFTATRDQEHCSMRCAARNGAQRRYERVPGHDLRVCECLACADARAEHGARPLVGYPA